MMVVRWCDEPFAVVAKPEVIIMSIREHLNFFKTSLSKYILPKDPIIKRKPVNPEHYVLDHILKIIHLCERIVGQGVLSIQGPDKKSLEQLFTSLDDLLFIANEETIDVVFNGLRRRNILDALLLIRAKYEHDREVHLARAIADQGDTSPLKKFRSHDWYQEAHDFENDILAGLFPKRIMVVGSGPFPTTALSLMDAFPLATVTCVERDAEACILSKQVAWVYGRSLNILCEDALDITDFSDYDVVIVGTIVGVLKSEKKLVLEHFLRHVPTSTALIFRSAVGPGRIIYPMITHLFGNTKHQVFHNPPQKTFTMILTDRDMLE